ncbi:MAG: ATPase, T2SS/T4P/T4SS family [Planctomycetota bacterium]
MEYVEHQPIGQILVSEGFCTEEDIQAALKEQATSGMPLGQVLVGAGKVQEEDLVYALAMQSGWEMIHLEGLVIPKEVIDKVSPSIAKVYNVIPVRMDGDSLVVAMADNMNVSVLDDLRFMLNCDVKGAICTKAGLEGALAEYYAGEEESFQDMLAEFDDKGAAEWIEAANKDDIDVHSLEQMSNEAPVIKLLNLVLLQAIKDHASDIHFEPFENEYKIRYRIDGALYDMMPPPKHLALAIASRIKVMSKLNIAERRLPQDGRIQLSIGGRTVDLRISTLPTMFGESVVIRVLDRTVVSLDIEKIGLPDIYYKKIEFLINLPHGIIIVTGPTGSGKTTTLYACLNRLNSPELKIITTEDPVEYEIDGLIQVPINAAIGVTYGACLRSILRQDPDTLLVGEIRDKETADIAIEAALTGHLVFSTLHTNDAPSSLTRLLDMGIEPFLIAATVQSIVAQRLVRTICNNCKKAYEPTDDMLMDLNLVRDAVTGQVFYYGEGCATCNNTGYKGRTAIFEILDLTEGVKQLIMEGASTEMIRDLGIQEGMRTLRESGIEKIFNGITTIEEVVKETMAIEGV